MNRNGLEYSHHRGHRQGDDRPLQPKHLLISLFMEPKITYSWCHGVPWAGRRVCRREIVEESELE
jgi:hypothetical protein